MSTSLRPYEPDQKLLLPEDLREWLPEGHLALFVMDVVRELDLKNILRHYEVALVKDEKGQVIGERIKASQGKPAYDPRMMTALLLYGYATGVVSSRQIEKRCQEDVAFRVIAGNQQPDHDTIANFRKVHLGALKVLFLQVLKLCGKAGLVKLGHVALDGTKVKANASKHKAMSYGHMVQREAELRGQIDALLRQAQEADDSEDQKHGKGKRGDELPEELARRESRLAKIQEAKAALEAEAKAEAEEKRRQEEEDRKRREDNDEPPKPGKKAEISETPKDKAQRNFTDPESRIMKNSDKENTGRVPKELSADAGYFSEENVKELRKRHIDPLIAAERKKHGERLPAARGPIPKGATLKEEMIRKLRTVAGRTAYALRKVTVSRSLARFEREGW